MSDIKLINEAVSAVFKCDNKAFQIEIIEFQANYNLKFMFNEKNL